MVRSVTTTEPEWSEQDQAWLLALQMWRDSLCQRCGGHGAETTNPANDRNNPQALGIYRALPPIECHRCTALMTVEREYLDDKRGLIHRVQLKPRRQPGG